MRQYELHRSTVRGVTLPDTGPTRRSAPSPYGRDLAALVCILVSLAGLTVLAWTVDWRLGAAVPLLGLLAVGVVVGIDR